VVKYTAPPSFTSIRIATLRVLSISSKVPSEVHSKNTGLTAENQQMLKLGKILSPEVVFFQLLDEGQRNAPADCAERPE